MRLTDHPLWPLIKPWVRIEVYDRDGGHSHPRHRIEVDAPVDATSVLCAVEVQCVHCGRPIHPIRQRQNRAGLFVAVTCELCVSYGCARSAAASDEYTRLVDLFG